MLRIHFFSIFTNKTPWALARAVRSLNSEDTDKCTLTITCYLPVVYFTLLYLNMLSRVCIGFFCLQDVWLS